MIKKDKMDLRVEYGNKYRIEYEKAYYCEYGRRARAEDPELQIIPCRHGEIFIWDANRLAVGTNSRGPIAKKLMGLDCVKVEQDGDDGVTLSFSPEHFRDVADVVKPRTNRRLSKRQLRALANGRASRSKTLG